MAGESQKPQPPRLGRGRRRRRLRHPASYVSSLHVAPGFAPVCEDSPRSLQGEPGTGTFQGGCQPVKFAESFFQSSVCEPDSGYAAASSQRPFRSGFAQM